MRGSITCRRPTRHISRLRPPRPEVSTNFIPHILWAGLLVSFKPFHSSVNFSGLESSKSLLSLTSTFLVRLNRIPPSPAPLQLYITPHAMAQFCVT